MMFFSIIWFLVVNVFTPTAKNLTENCKLQHYKLICENTLPNDTFWEITELELNNFASKNIDLTLITFLLPNLGNLTIKNDGIDILPKGITLEVPRRKNNLKVLNVAGLGISKITNNFLSDLQQIEELNLRRNLLTTLNSSSIMNVKKVYLAGNRWNCSESLEWVDELTSSVVRDLDELTCYGPPYAGKPLMAIATFLKDMKLNCTDTCNCSLTNVVMNPKSEILEPIIEVNCSNRGFDELPTKFPRETKIFHLEGNNIRDLKALRLNTIYRNILDLYVDNNRINSVQVLEGSYWLTHFRVFSLSGNTLTEIPSYALDNALQQNVNMPNAVQISLGKNPWRCDCVFTPIFQELLQKYASQITDIEDVKCSYKEGDENSFMRIIELSRSSLCRYPKEYSIQEALNLLNVVLGTLIIFIIAKLAYDYYHFKKTGSLPWIATKLP